MPSIFHKTLWVSWLDIAGRYGLDSINAAKISEIVDNLTRSDISSPFRASG
ncbi:MAG: hypothetical protein WA820_14775 [Bradyrhizobium sp.]|jgi:hypothetical protein